MSIITTTSKISVQSRTSKVLFLSFGQFLASISGVVIAMVLSREFSTHDYGTYKQVLLCFVIALPFLSLGIPMAIYYYLPNEQRRPRGFIIDSFILLTAIGGVYIVFILLGGARFLSGNMNNPDLAGLLYLMAPYVIIQLIRLCVEPILMSADKVRLLAIFNAVSRSFECLFIIIAIVAFGNLVSVVAATLIAGALVSLAAVILIFRTYESGSLSPSLFGIKQQLFYGVPLGLAALFGSTIGYVDQLIVSLKVPAEDFAIYVNGAIRIPLLSIVVMSITAVLLPELSRMHKNSDKAGMLRVWQNAMVKSSYVMLPMSLFLMILAKDFILLVFSEKYIESISIFRIFLVMLPFQMVSYGPIFHASNKNKYIVLINVVSLFIHIPLLFLSIRYFGIIGAAATTLFSRVCICIFLHIFFISRIVLCPTLKVVPISRLFHVMMPAVVLALPLVLRYTFGVSHFIALPICALYYFPVCYLWLTRKCGAPRVVIIETAFCLLNPHRRMD